MLVWPSGVLRGVGTTLGRSHCGIKLHVFTNIKGPTGNTPHTWFLQLLLLEGTSMKYIENLETECEVV